MLLALTQNPVFVVTDAHAALRRVNLVANVNNVRLISVTYFCNFLSFFSSPEFNSDLKSFLFTCFAVNNLTSRTNTRRIFLLNDCRIFFPRSRLALFLSVHSLHIGGLQTFKDKKSARRARITISPVPATVRGSIFSSCAFLRCGAAAWS